MKKTGMSRKDFLKNTALSFAGLALTPALSKAGSALTSSEHTAQAGGSYLLKNVRLETGFEYQQDEVLATKTDLFTVEVENGKIKAISANQAESNAIDAHGMLMLPAFKDMH